MSLSVTLMACQRRQRFSRPTGVHSFVDLRNSRTLKLASPAPAPPVNKIDNGPQRYLLKKGCFFTSNENSIVETDCSQAPSNRWQRSSIHPRRGSLGVQFCVVSLDAIFVGTSSNQKNLKNILSNLIFFNIWSLVFIIKKWDNALIPNSRQCQWSVRKRATFCPSEDLEMALSSPLIPESCKQWPVSVNLLQAALLLCSLRWQQSYLLSWCRMPH